jgi:2,3-bisphosphoglycerate-independent phosphoglycerate mutase
MAQAPHVLIILDGFGYRQEIDDNAILKAHPANFSSWMSKYPHSTLSASGIFVGLLPHMIGNSEVGHMTIGSGRRIVQPVAEITHQIATGAFYADKIVEKRFNELIDTPKRLHFMGLLSDAGVHSHIDHLKALIKCAQIKKIEQIIVHPFLDGRDVPPKTAAFYLSQLEEALGNSGIIGSLHGRFYAMDRDNNWDRTKESYKILTQTQKQSATSWQEALEKSYAAGITDEFFKPVALHESAAIKRQDAVVFFNFRADRARQLTGALVAEDFSSFTTRHLDLSSMLTFTSYHEDFPVDVLLRKKIVQNTLFDVLEKHEFPLFSIAETEKYAHITYFFNGGRELIRQHETRILIPSKKHHETYASIPCMSAPEITDAVISALNQNKHRFYLVNFANADMVGHSGDFAATVKAIHCLDYELGRLYKKIVEELKGTLYITADHGKAEEMWDFQVGQPRTAHTTNHVPFLYIGSDENASARLPLTELADIAPFILKNLGLEVPLEMSKQHVKE